jgi:hypothetical protein
MESLLFVTAVISTQTDGILDEQVSLRAADYLTWFLEFARTLSSPSDRAAVLPLGREDDQSSNYQFIIASTMKPDYQLNQLTPGVERRDPRHRCTAGLPLP